MLVFESPEEFHPIDSIEGRGGPVEDFHEAQGFELHRRCNLLEERANHRNMKGPTRDSPFEPCVLDVLRSPAPENPGRENAVEQRLDEGRTEEVLPFFALELEAERLFEGGPKR